MRSHQVSESDLSPQLITAEVTLGGVLSGIGLLVVQSLHKAVIASRDQSTEERSNPVNPVVSGEASCGDTRSEAARRVKRSASVVDTCAFMLIVALRLFILKTSTYQQFQQRTMQGQCR